MRLIRAMLKRRKASLSFKPGQDAGFLSSREVLHAQVFAIVLARELDDSTLDLRHLLGGLYLSCSKSISRYSEDIYEFDNFFHVECKLDEPDWFYWFRTYELMYEPTRSSLVRISIPKSETLAKVYADAIEIARSAGGVSEKPILIPEDILLAVGKNHNVDLRIDRMKLKLKELEEACATRVRGVA
jgi:hypothetical protein